MGKSHAVSAPFRLMGLRARLVRELADGERHTTSGLARGLSAPAAQVVCEIAELPALGLHVETPAQNNWQLSRPLDLLTAQTIRADLSSQVASRLDALTVTAVTQSTNDDLRTRAAPGPGRFAVALAEFQTAGRGRLGREWVSPFASGICLSISTALSSPLAQIGTLSLALGVAVHRGISALGVSGLKLKWPNDLMINDEKLGGLLVETDSSNKGAARVIVGLGVNVEPVQPAAGLQPAALRGRTSVPLGRSALAARLINSLADGLMKYMAEGFSAFSADWQQHDALDGRELTVQLGNAQLVGVARGINPAGELQLETAAGMRTVAAGEVSLGAL